MIKILSVPMQAVVGVEHLAQINVGEDISAWTCRFAVKAAPTEDDPYIIEPINGTTDALGVASATVPDTDMLIEPGKYVAEFSFIEATVNVLVVQFPFIVLGRVINT